jgi:hypothetical protein
MKQKGGPTAGKKPGHDVAPHIHNQVIRRVL